MTEKETKRTKELIRKEGRLSDDKNPEFLFHLIHTDLLVQIAKGIIKTKKLAYRELKRRGLNKDGFWVGFRNGYDRGR
jgi:hypothetical protein